MTPLLKLPHPSSCSCPLRGVSCSQQDSGYTSAQAATQARLSVCLSVQRLVLMSHSEKTCLGFHSHSCLRASVCASVWVVCPGCLLHAGQKLWQTLGHRECSGRSRVGSAFLRTVMAAPGGPEGKATDAVPAEGVRPPFAGERAPAETWTATAQAAWEPC